MLCLNSFNEIATRKAEIIAGMKEKYLPGCIAAEMLGSRTRPTLLESRSLMPQCLFEINAHSCLSVLQQAYFEPKVGDIGNF